MQPRRPLRLVAGALVLALPLLSSCGFGKATDRVYNPGVGTNYRDGDLKVLAAVVVAAQPDSGTFVASLANGAGTDSAELTQLAGAGEWQELTFGEVSPPIEVAPGGFVNLAEEGGITVSGDFEAGDYVELTLTFGDGDSITMGVPVVYACDDYEGLDTSSGSDLSPVPQTEESESPGTEPTTEPTDETTPSPSETDEATTASREDSYDCGSVRGG